MLGTKSNPQEDTNFQKAQNTTRSFANTTDKPDISSIKDSTASIQTHHIYNTTD